MDSKQIAKKRGWQTFADGLIVVAFIGLVAPIFAAIGNSQSWGEWISGWQEWTWLAFQGAFVAGGTALVAWLRRRFVQTADKDTEGA